MPMAVWPNLWVTGLYHRQHQTLLGGTTAQPEPMKTTAPRRMEKLRKSTIRRHHLTNFRITSFRSNIRHFGTDEFKSHADSYPPCYNAHMRFHAILTRLQTTSVVNHNGSNDYYRNGGQYNEPTFTPHSPAMSR